MIVVFCCLLVCEGMAPEILKQMKYDPKVDVWSLGVSAYELVTSRPPYSELPYMKASHHLPLATCPLRCCGGTQWLTAVLGWVCVHYLSIHRLFF